MEIQTITEKTLRHEIDRLGILVEEAQTGLMARDAMLAAARYRIHLLEEQRRWLFWLVIVLAVMVVIAVSSGR